MRTHMNFDANIAIFQYFKKFFRLFQRYFFDKRTFVVPMCYKLKIAQKKFGRYCLRKY